MEEKADEREKNHNNFGRRRKKVKSKMENWQEQWNEQSSGGEFDVNNACENSLGGKVP